MPVEIHELIVRARVQQSGTENEAQPGRANEQNAQENETGGRGQQTEQIRPTVEEIVHDIIKRTQER